MASPARAAIESNTSEILKGKNPRPVIDRECDPLLRVIQRGTMLEVLLTSLPGKAGATSESEGYIRELVATHNRLFRNPQSVSAALAVRNSLMHARGRFIGIEDKSRAAQSLAEAIEDVLPQVSPELRAAVTSDPHEQGESETLAQIRSEDLNEAARMRKLARRLDALLAICDARDRHPVYDLAPGQFTPSLAQRVKQNAGRFSPAESCELLNVANAAAEVATYTEQKVRHMEKKLRSGNRALEAAVQKLEIEMGISQPEAEAEKPQEIQPAPTLCVETPASAVVAPEQPVQAVEPSPAVEPAPEAPLPFSFPTPQTVADALAAHNAPIAVPDCEATPRPFRVRIRLTPPAVSTMRRLLAAAACLVLAASLSCLLTTTRADGTTSPGARTSPGAPSLVWWTAPAMTPEARRAGVRGNLVLRIWVNRRGVPARIEVSGRLGYGLETMAVAAAMHWRFTPPQNVQKDPVEVPVEFDSTVEP